MSNKKIECFVIMPISDHPNYMKGHFSLVYEDIIKPAIINNDMKPIRADETKNTNLIHLDILKRIIETPIAVCDMSSKNPNVFFELGMRQAFDKPTVLIKDEETEAPFDISGLRYITYNQDMRHRDVLNAIDELTKSIKETYSKKDDKTKINSLIRLMEFSSSAKLNKLDISDAEKIKRLHEIELSEIKSSIKNLMNNQRAMFRTLNENIKNNNHTFSQSIENSNINKNINYDDFLIDEDDIPF